MLVSPAAATPPTNPMYDIFAALTKTRPDAPALIDGGTGVVTTRATLLGRGNELAAELTASGFAGGDAIGVQLPNSVEFVAAFLAIAQLGLVAFPIDRDAPGSEVGAILTHFAIKGLIYRAEREGCGVAISTRHVSERPLLPAGARLVKLTSGSTGRPKGIVTSEANLIADCINICSTMDIGPGDLNLGAIPFSHSYGFSNLVMPLLLHGTPLVISNDYLPQSILALCNEYRCTIVPAIPMVFDHLATLARGDGEFESVRTFLSAGAPLNATTSKRFRERFGIPIHTFYGCSECGGITYDRAGAAVEQGVAGYAMDNVVLTLDTTTSRLMIRSAAVALGYLHDASTFVAFEPCTFTTDDTAEVGQSGEVSLTGRIGDLINTAGKKVNPREVEHVLLQMDGIHQVKVYGEPAGARGEVVAAAVVASPDVTREQIRNFCRARLSLHKVPRIVKLIERIPLDERGKVKRSALALL